MSLKTKSDRIGTSARAETRSYCCAIIRVFISLLLSQNHNIQVSGRHVHIPARLIIVSSSKEARVNGSGLRKCG
jgi:hypothetical protein